MFSKNPPKPTPSCLPFLSSFFPMHTRASFPYFSSFHPCCIANASENRSYSASACLLNKGGKKNLKLKFAGFHSWLVDYSYIFHMRLFCPLCSCSISILNSRLFLFFFNGGRSATLNASLGPPVSAAADITGRVIGIEIIFLHLPVLLTGVASIALSPCRSLIG